MRRFRWLGGDRLIPSADLRVFGWTLTSHEVGALPDCPVLVDVAWAPPEHISAALLGIGEYDTTADGHWRRWLVLLGIDRSAARAGLISDGYGDALPSSISLAELAARVTRVRKAALALVPERRHGDLRLDLMAREGYVDGQALGLHPREFALLWRLMEHPGEVVEKRVLLRDVWRQHHMPETNSIAVHASRLRAKLSMVGQGGLLQTAPGGGYYLVNRRQAARVMSAPSNGVGDVIRLHWPDRAR